MHDQPPSKKYFDQVIKTITFQHARESSYPVLHYSMDTILADHVAHERFFCANDDVGWHIGLTSHVVLARLFFPSC